MKERTITLEKLKESGVEYWHRKDNSPRGCDCVSISEIKPGDEVVIDNYFTLVVEEPCKKYTILQTYGNYTVLKRDTDFQPFIVANHLQADMTWAHGHYFQDLFDAADFARSRGSNKIPYERISEIATRFKDALEGNDINIAYIMDDFDLALTEEEKEYFGIEEY